MRRALQCALLGAALCGPTHLYAKTELLKTQPGSVVHWSRAIITVGVDPGARSKTVDADDVTIALAHAAQAWNNVRAEQPILEAVAVGQPDVTVRFCAGQWEGETIDLGKSRFTASLLDGTVTGATVEINECDHRFVAPDRPTRTAYDLQAVLTHELGHVLGLGHSDNRAAIMFPSGGGATIRAPHIEDQTTLALIYFGRARLAVPKKIPTSYPVGAALAAVDTPLRTGAVEAAPEQPESTDRKAANALPEGSVSLLSLKNAAGQDVTIYTCEPTLLPPIAAEPESRRREPARHGRRTHP
jgi:predicted Zn-dependent protease